MKAKPQAKRFEWGFNFSRSFQQNFDLHWLQKDAVKSQTLSATIAQLGESKLALPFSLSPFGGNWPPLTSVGQMMCLSNMHQGPFLVCPNKELHTLCLQALSNVFALFAPFRCLAIQRTRQAKAKQCTCPWIVLDDQIVLHPCCCGGGLV